MRKLWLMLSFILLISSVSAWTNTTFNNSLSNEQLNLAAGIAQIRYLAVPSDVSILMNGTMNLSGFRGGVGRYENDSIEENPATALIAEVGGATWKSQTFTVGTTGSNIAYTIANVSMFLGNRLGTPGTCVVGIRAVDGANKPTGNDLANGTFNCNNVQVGAGTRDWINFTMTTPFTVTTSTKYAIVLRAVGGTPGVNSVSAFGTSTSTYTGGTRVSSTDSGATWTVNAGDDLNFIIFGTTGDPINFTIGVGQVTTTVSANGTTPYSEIITGLQTSINTYLSSCTTVGGYCNVPFVFNSSTAGSLNYSNMYFTTNGMLVNQQSYHNTTSEGSSEFFGANITIDTSTPPSVAYLIYNSTTYTATLTSLGGGNYSISKTVNVPSVAAVTNITWYWNVYTDGGLNYTTNPTNQTVSKISFTCSAGTIVAFNVTLSDEDSLAKINGTIEAIVNLYTANTTNLVSSYNGTLTYVTGQSAPGICLPNTPSTYDITYQFKYYNGSSLYQTEYYNGWTYAWTNNTATQIVNLYDLLTSRATVFTFTVEAPDLTNLAGAVILVQRKYVYLNQFNNVEAPITDSTGKTVANLVAKTEVYNFLVYKNGVLLGTFNNNIVKCQNEVTSECAISLNLIQATTGLMDYSLYGNLSANIYLNKTTRVLRMDYTTTDGATHNVSWDIIKNDGYSNNTICSNSLVSTAGTFTCTVPSSYGNISLYTMIYSDNIFVGRQFFNLNDNPSDIFGGTRIVLGMLMYGTLTLMMIAHPLTILIGAVLGMGFAGAFYLVDGGSLFGTTSIIAWFIIAGGIIFFWAKNRI